MTTEAGNRVQYSYLQEQFAQPQTEEAASMRVRYIELAKSFRAERTLDAIRELLKTGDFTLGDEVEQFEKRFAQLCGARFAVGVNSGTDALFLGLKALDIGPGDEVITQANTFVATAGAIVQAGATPVFADVLPDLTIDPEDAEARITSRTRAIMPVHYTGNMGDIHRVMAMAARHRLHVVEDAAQAAGASNFGQPAGSFGIVAGFSLHPLKNLNVWGDGGAVTTYSPEIAARLRLLRNHGLRGRDEVETWGYNTRLDTLQAIVANILLDDLDDITEARIRNAGRYDEGLRELAPQIEIPPRIPTVRHVYHLYVVFAERRDELLAHLIERGVEAKIHYPRPLHLQPAAEALGYSRGDFPRAEAQAERQLTLPVHQHLDERQIDFVVDQIRAFYRG